MRWLELIQLCRLFVLGKNNWNYNCKLVVWKIITWRYNCLQRIIINPLKPFNCVNKWWFSYLKCKIFWLIFQFDLSTLESMENGNGHSQMLQLSKRQIYLAMTIQLTSFGQYRNNLTSPKFSALILNSSLSWKLGIGLAYFLIELRILFPS